MLVGLPVLVGLLAALVAARTGAQDQPEFVAAGLRLLGPDRWDVYDDPWYQIGPLHLLLVGLVARLAGAVGADPVVVTVGAAWSALTAAAALTARLLVTRAARSTPAEVGSWGVAAAAVVLGVVVTARPVTLAHPEELAIALLWCLAAAAAARSCPGPDLADRWPAWRDASADLRRVAAAVGLVVLAAALKPTGALGAVVLLQLPLRALLPAAAAAAVGSAAVYAPFAVLGSFRMTQQEWVVTPGTLPWLLDPAGTHAGWGVRLAQAVVVVAAVALAVAALRPPPAALVVVLVAVRLLLDPVYLVYYAAPLLLVAVLAAAEHPAVQRSAAASARRRLVVATPLLLVVLGHAAAEPRTLVRYALLTTALVGVTVTSSGTPRRVPVPGPEGGSGPRTRRAADDRSDGVAPAGARS